MSTKRAAGSRPPVTTRARPPTANLALALARCAADHLLGGDGNPTADEKRAALEQALGRGLSPMQARLLAAREASRVDVRALAERLPGSAPGAHRQNGLARADLDLLPLPLWRECAEWLLGAEGYQLTRVTHHAAEHSPLDADISAVERLFWRGERSGTSLLVVAVRLGEHTPLDAQEVRASEITARDFMGAHDAIPLLILSPAMPTVGAILAARATQADLLAGAAVDDVLTHLAVEYAEEQARESESAEERATAAARARSAIQKALHDLSRATERAMKVPTRGKKRAAATSRAAVAEAVVTLAPHLRALAQISLAWETLLDEWSAAFGAHAERAGALPILREPPEFAALAERAKHLRTVALPALEAIAATPPAGELGYGAWRAGICEVLSLHWQALETRLCVVEPTSWHDFSLARDTAHEAAASRLKTEYSHAAARLQKVRADLASRAALDVPEV